MSLSDRFSERANRHLRQAAAMATENPEMLDIEAFIRDTAARIAGNGENGGNGEALRAVTAAAVRAISQRDQMLAAMKALKEQLAEGPKPVRVLSDAFDFGTNGQTRKMVWVGNLGPGGNPVFPVVIAEDDVDELPAPLELAFVDAGGKVYLGPAGEVPLSCRESPVVRADSAARFGLGEVVIREAMDHHDVLWCSRETAEKIQEMLDSGTEVSVRHDGAAVLEIADERNSGGESWLEWLDAEGPELEDMVFPAWLARRWAKNARRMARGRSVMALCQGGTGTGKSEAPIRAARAAARKCGRRPVLIRFSLARIGSSYWSQTEQNIVAIKERAVKLAREGCLVVIIVDEADGILGNSEGRYESSTGRSVRNTFQSEFSDAPAPFCSIFLTMNIRKDSWLPAPILRRYEKIIYPVSTRAQIARVAAEYADVEAMGVLGTTPEDFGKQTADFLYADSFQVARASYHSGRRQAVRARDLRDLCPGRIKSLSERLCEDVADGEVTCLADFWPELDREFRGVALTEANLFELTYLDPPENDTVRKVERIDGASPCQVVEFAQPV